MLHTHSTHNQAGSILFEDASQTTHSPAGATVRPATETDPEVLSRLELYDGARWLLEVNGEIAGAGVVLYHYNCPNGVR